MEQIQQFIKYTISGKILLFNTIIFIIILLIQQGGNTGIFPLITLHNLNIIYQQIDISIYFFYQIPAIIHPGTILSTFSHSGIFHMLFNSYVLFILGPLIENLSGKRIFIKLIIFSMSFSIIGVLISPLLYIILPGDPAPVLGFSGVLMGMLAFIYFRYKYTPGLDQNQILIFLIINLAIGLFPMISLVGHLSGALGGYIYAYLLNKIDRI